jgi:hypothetical protein
MAAHNQRTAAAAVGCSFSTFCCCCWLRQDVQSVLPWHVTYCIVPLKLLLQPLVQCLLAAAAAAAVVTVFE